MKESPLKGGTSTRTVTRGRSRTRSSQASLSHPTAEAQDHHQGGAVHADITVWFKQLGSQRSVIVPNSNIMGESLIRQFKAGDSEKDIREEVKNVEKEDTNEIPSDKDRGGDEENIDRVNRNYSSRGGTSNRTTTGRRSRTRMH